MQKFVFQEEHSAGFAIFEGGMVDATKLLVEGTRPNFVKGVLL